MTTAAAFVLLAAAGATLRWRAAERLGDRSGVFLANLAGSFAVGLLAGVAAPTATVIGVGGLGALTTFSTFVQQATTLAENQPERAATFVVATVGGSVLAAAVGLGLA